MAFLPTRVYTYGMTTPSTHTNPDAYYVVAEEEWPRVYGPYATVGEASADARRVGLLDWRAWSVDYTEMVRRAAAATDAGYAPQFRPPLGARG